MYFVFACVCVGRWGKGIVSVVIYVVYICVLFIVCYNVLCVVCYTVLCAQTVIMTNLCAVLRQ